MKSSFVLVVEALELGIPVKLGEYLCKQFDNEIKFAAVSSKEGDIYMGNFGWDYVYRYSQDLTEGDRMQLVHLMVQIKEKIEKGHDKENLTYQHENEHFDKLRGAYPKVDA